MAPESPRKSFTRVNDTKIDIDKSAAVNFQQKRHYLILVINSFVFVFFFILLLLFILLQLENDNSDSGKVQNESEKWKFWSYIWNLHGLSDCEERRSDLKEKKNLEKVQKYDKYRQKHSFQKKNVCILKDEIFSYYFYFYILFKFYFTTKRNQLMLVISIFS